MRTRQDPPAWVIDPVTEEVRWHENDERPSTTNPQASVNPLENLSPRIVSDFKYNRETRFSWWERAIIFLGDFLSAGLRFAARSIHPLVSLLFLESEKGANHANGVGAGGAARQRIAKN